MNIEDYTYALALRLPANKSLEALFYSKQFYPISLNPDGYYYENKVSGMYHLCKAKDLDNLAKKYHWPIQHQCPFVETVSGYCLIHPFNKSTFLWLIEQILSVGQGFIARLDNGWYLDIVSKKTMPLKNVVDRHGFNEGLLILNDTKWYHQYIRNTIEQALKPIDLVPYIYNSGDHEHILQGFKNDETHRTENWKLFEQNANKIMLELWVANWDYFKENIKSILHNTEKDI